MPSQTFPPSCAPQLSPLNSNNKANRFNNYSRPQQSDTASSGRCYRLSPDMAADPESVDVAWLGRQLQTNQEHVLLLDCRTAMDYNLSHIQTAIHVVIPTLMQKRLKKGNLSVESVIKCNESKQTFHSKWKTETTVVYDECTTDTESDSTCLGALLYKKLQEDGCRARFLRGRSFSTYAYCKFTFIINGTFQSNNRLQIRSI